MPHLAYYDRASLLSFVWSGRPNEPIHVQHGGYGEPTIALIDIEAFYPAGEQSPAELFDWYRDLCDTWNLEAPKVLCRRYTGCCSRLRAS
ncbi:MAG: hypothetical protein H5T76_39950 [Streptomyces sp.]|nr:hypothetical protein [Streptomyces sp.]